MPLTAAPAAGCGELATLGRIIGDARVVAFGEGEHCAAEVLELRNRLFRYLVEAKGFTAIALESGLVESRRVHDYVRGAAGDLISVVAEGMSWRFDRLPQNEALVRWLRQHNLDPSCSRKVNFYGCDVSGSPGDSSARRGLGTALLEAVDYLARVDEPAATAFRARLQPLKSRLRFELHDHTAVPGYDRLTSAERDAMTAIVADLIALFQCRERRYTAASSAEDYERAYRAAIGARQTDGWLRCIPMGWSGSGEQLRFLQQASELRDCAQAENVEWLVRREEEGGKVFVFAHNAHLSAKPVEWTYTAQEHFCHEGAGTHLRRRLGGQLISIGTLIGGGAIGYADFEKTLQPPLAQSMDGIAAEVGLPCFLLDLRALPRDLAGWFSEVRPFGRGFEYPGKFSVCQQTDFSEAFDLVIYLEAVTPAAARAVS